MKSGNGLIELLVRLGITPTLDRAKDIQLAKVEMNKQRNKVKVNKNELPR
jgi:hypothetical protein